MHQKFNYRYKNLYSVSRSSEVQIENSSIIFPSIEIKAYSLDLSCRAYNVYTCTFYGLEPLLQREHSRKLKTRQLTPENC